MREAIVSSRFAIGKFDYSSGIWPTFPEGEVRVSRQTTVFGTAHPQYNEKETTSVMACQCFSDGRILRTI